MPDRITELSFINKIILEKYIKKGDHAVDATLGNGHDTITLLEIVGKNGKVSSYDIQEEAIKNSKENLKDFKDYNIEFILKSHEYMNFNKGEISGIVFNLGYLPNFEHKIKTEKISTINAIIKGLDFLKINGIISITSYLGHDNGEEYGEIIDFCKKLDSKNYKVLEINPLNQSNLSPKLIIIQKLIN